MEFTQEAIQMMKNPPRSTLGSVGNQSNPLTLGEGLFGQLNGRILNANAELSRIAQTLEQTAYRVFGSVPQPVGDGQGDRREPYSAADALNSATEQTHRLISAIDTQMQRLLGGF